MVPSRPAVRIFRGLNNMVDSLDLGLEWQSRADNVEITNRGKIKRAQGWARVTTNTAITGAYATDDLQRLYVFDSGELRRMDPDLGSYQVLKTGLDPSAIVYFTEANGVVYYSNGLDRGRIDQAGAKLWGITPPLQPQLSVGGGQLLAGTYSVCCTLRDRQDGIESGNGDVATIDVPDGSQIAINGLPQVAGFDTNVYVTARNAAKPFYQLVDAARSDSASYNCPPEALGPELRFWLLDPPRGTIPCYFRGAMLVAEWIPELDQTALWKSEPLMFHHFDYGNEAKMIPGRVLMLRATPIQPGPSMMLIGTDRAVHSFDGVSPFVELARYGVVPGVHCSKFGDQLYFWTMRGLCRALPFENLTMNQLSVAPGTSAAGAVIEQAGNVRYVAALHKGGVAYNPRGS